MKEKIYTIPVTEVFAHECECPINSGKGFCIKHFKELLEGSVKCLSEKEISIFAANLIDLQIKNLEFDKSNPYVFPLSAFCFPTSKSAIASLRPQ